MKGKGLFERSLPSRELASKGGKVVVGGDGEAGGSGHFHLGGLLRHLGVDLVGLDGDKRRGVDRHSD